MSKATAGPWKWGDGWDEIKHDRIDPEDEYSGPKYADLSLRGPGNKTIIGLRIDHYCVEWDSENDVYDLSDADRALIAASPELRDCLRAFVTFHGGHVLPPELQAVQARAREVLAGIDAEIAKEEVEP